MPGVQNPHWIAPRSTKACCSGCSVPSGAAMPSIVSTLFPATSFTRLMQIFERLIVDEDGARAASADIACVLGAG
jgi:hypothetical protein